MTYNGVMKIISLSVGRPRLVAWMGQTVSTGIFKTPVEGRVMLRTLNLDGDRQADLSVHGGPDKAVYAYPSEHYGYWRGELPGTELPWGMFGENFTTEGLDESSVNVGERFLASGRTGFYFSVQREGEVGAGDEFELIGRDGNGVTVADITRLYARDRGDFETMRRAVALEALPESWRDHFRQQLAKSTP
jgi:MOSC domain-containing protein YiiM